MTFQAYDSATFKARFAENLIRYRRRAGLSQEKVCDPRLDQPRGRQQVREGSQHPQS